MHDPSSNFRTSMRNLASLYLAALLSASCMLACNAHALNPVAARELRARAITPYPAHELRAFNAKPVRAKELPGLLTRPLLAHELMHKAPAPAANITVARDTRQSASPKDAQPASLSVREITPEPPQPNVARSNNPEDYDPAAY